LLYIGDTWDIFGAELERCIPAAGWLPLLLTTLLLLLAAGGVAGGADDGAAAPALLLFTAGELGAALKINK